MDFNNPGSHQLHGPTAVSLVISIRICHVSWMFLAVVFVRSELRQGVRLRAPSVPRASAAALQAFSSFPITDDLDLKFRTCCTYFAASVACCSVTRRLYACEVKVNTSISLTDPWQRGRGALP